MNNRPSLTALLLALVLLAPASGQQPSPKVSDAGGQQQQTAPQDDSDVVRITANLVQIDAVVLDKEGRQVTDLTAEDFEILEDGKPREITAFSYVPLTATSATAPPRAQPADGKARAVARTAPPVPSAPLRREEVRRTVALVVDDLMMSFGSVEGVRDGLRKFVNEQMQPGDLVAIYRTRGGSGALQQFTSDKAQLHKAVDAIRWYPAVLGGLSGDVVEAERSDSTFKPPLTNDGGGPRGRQSFEDKSAKEARERNEDRNADLSAYGSFGMLRYILKGLDAAPGRKTVVLFSDGFPLAARDGSTGRAIEALNRVIDAANRAAVNIYTVDARGLMLPADLAARLTPQSDAMPSWPGSAPDLSRPRPRDDDAMHALAEGTGGLFIRNRNFMDKALVRVIREQSGYYLLGYRPSSETFKGGRASFRDIDVKVKRAGLTVRHRKGFMAVADEEIRPARGTDNELYSILASPINAGEVYVRTTASVVSTPAGGQAARLLLHIDGGDLTFTDEQGGWKKLVLDVAAVTLGKEGEIVDEFTRTHTVRTGGEVLGHIQQNGLTYAADVPLKKPGSYQLRIVVRDQASQRVGSASQLIEVPDLSKKRLAMSGITLREAEAGGDDAQGQKGLATAATALAPVVKLSDPAVRRFPPGAAIAYGYQVYNATRDSSAGQPRLTARLRLFHDGAPVLDSGPAPVELSTQQSDPARPLIGGTFRTPPDAKPGAYVLQIVVTDALDKGGRQATQWIDFEVIE